MEKHPVEKLVTEVPSEYCQWTENKSQFHIEEMTTEDIMHYRDALSHSYKCEPADITWKFENKTKDRLIVTLDRNDQIDEEYIYLVYTQRTIEKNGAVGSREISRLKVKIPEAVKQRVSMLKKP